MTPDSGLQRLAVAVLRQAFTDARTGTAMEKRQALAWLSSTTNSNLHYWCACAGVPVAGVRDAADRLRHRAAA